MQLNIEKLNTMPLTVQMTAARQHQQFTALNAKAVKLPADLKQLQSLRESLRPYDLDQQTAPTATPAVVERKELVLNQIKIDRANLSGAARLTLHREAEALARLMQKDANYLSPAEIEQVKKAKEGLVHYIGPADREGRETDFALRVAA